MSVFAALLVCLAPVPIDGDTVKCGNTQVSVRLFSVLAPEIRDVGGQESKASLVLSVSGGLMCEIRGASYNRTVAICKNSKGIDVGLTQIKSGHAKEDCAYSRNYYATCSVSRRKN